MAVQPSATTRSIVPSRCFGLYTGSSWRNCLGSAQENSKQQVPEAEQSTAKRRSAPHAPLPDCFTL
jgi:hypothetical protein